MKSIVLNGISEMGIITGPDPVLDSKNDVLVRVSHVGVCGSDMHFYNTGRIGANQVKYPFVLGHEGAGIVEKTGPGVVGLEKGQRISIEPAMPCHKCDQCLAGRPHTCRNLSFMGNPGQSTGLLSESVVIPEDSCYPLPEHLGNELAVLAEPLSIAVWAGDLAGVKPDMSIGILGSGPIGLSVLKYCRFLGAERIYTTDKLDYRLGMAVDAGAGWTGNPDSSDIVSGIIEEEVGGLDLVFDCCGMQEAIDQAIQLIKPGGKIMIIGIPEFDQWSLPTDETRRKEICFQNVRRQNERLQKAIDLIAENKIDMFSLITHRFHFEETDKAFDLVSGYRDGVMKAIIEY
ncbi:zinc-binding dehydrogenase [Bacteroidota bacterium]